MSSNSSRKFLEKFPPPEFLSVPSVGIIFSDSNIKVFSMEKDSHHPTLYVTITLEPGVIESGIIKKEEALEQALSSIRQSIKTPFVKFTLPDEVAYVFYTKVPVLPGKDARESVAFILEENVPLPLLETSFDFTPIKIEKNGEVFMGEVAVTAVSSAIIESYIKVLRKSHLEPVLCINESEPIARALIEKDSKDNFVIVNMKPQSIGIYMTEGQVVAFSSTLVGLQEPSLVLELKKAIHYWKDKNPNINKKVNDGGRIKCLLCGDYSLAKSALEAMKDMHEVAPVLGNVWTNTFSLQNYIPKISLEDSLSLGGGVGLFL